MASAGATVFPPGTALTSTEPLVVPHPNPLAQPTNSESFQTSSISMELSNLSQQNQPTSDTLNPSRETPSTIPEPLQSQTVNQPSQDPPSTSTSPSAPIEPAPTTLTRTPTAPAIGPSTDHPHPPPPPTTTTASALPLPPTSTDTEPTLHLTLLLTTGARHPYAITLKYLRKRNVAVESDNPLEISIYTLKELIWREWREEWEVRPSSPSAIRLIYAGGMPEERRRLGECKFTLGPAPHVVHMTVKPQDFIDEEEAQKGGARDREGMERSPRCRCCVM